MDVLAHLRSIVFTLNRDDIRSVQALLTRATGDHIAATMLLRLLYWMPKSRTGWIFKSWRDWEAECGLSRAQIKRVHGKKLLETAGVQREIRKACGAPTMHYHIDINALLEKITQSLGIPVEAVQMQEATEGENHPDDEAESDQSNERKSPNAKGENNPTHRAETDQSITDINQQTQTTQTNNKKPLQLMLLNHWKN